MSDYPYLTCHPKSQHYVPYVQNKDLIIMPTTTISNGGFFLISNTCQITYIRPSPFSHYMWSFRARRGKKALDGFCKLGYEVNNEPWIPPPNSLDWADYILKVFRFSFSVISEKVASEWKHIVTKVTNTIFDYYRIPFLHMEL